MPADADWVIERGDFGTVTLDVRPAGEAGPVFVGIGPTDDVSAYLDGVNHDVFADLFDDSGDEVTYEHVDGDRTPSPPGEETFWAAQATGGEALTWEVESGDWTAVVMNADGSSGIDVVARAGIKLDWLLPVAIVVLVFGYLLLAGGVVLAVFGARGPRSTTPPPAIQAPPAAAVPPGQPPLTGAAPAAAVPPPPPPTTPTTPPPPREPLNWAPTFAPAGPKNSDRAL